MIEPLPASIMGWVTMGRPSGSMWFNKVSSSSRQDPLHDLNHEGSCTSFRSLSSNGRARSVVPRRVRIDAFWMPHTMQVQVRLLPALALTLRDCLL